LLFISKLTPLHFTFFTYPINPSLHFTSLYFALHIYNSLPLTSLHFTFYRFLPAFEEW